MKNEINLYSNYYFQEGTSEDFIELAESIKLNNNEIIDHNMSKMNIVRLFLDQVEMTNEIFQKYDNNKKQ